MLPEITPFPADPRYGVTRCGRVFRITSYGRCKTREMTRHLGKRGYLIVIIDGRYLPVHRIVAQTYLPNPDELPIVAHRNGTRTDNSTGNLRWSTALDNCADTILHGRTTRGDRCPTRKLAEADVPVIRGLLRTAFRHRDIADRYGVTRECIGRIAQGRNWRHVAL